jgi:predicted negative regulator of RcsB-dependent stress response
MNRARPFQIACGCLAVVAMLVASVANAATDSQNEKVVASFLKHIGSLDKVSDQQKTEITKSVRQLGQSPDAITEGLIEIYPEFEKAVRASDDEDIDQAVTLLSPLADSDDKFLAADANFYLARALMNSERYEEAMPRLEQLNGVLGDFTAHQGTSQYFVGVAQAGLLKNSEAIKSFMEFLQFNPDAPERLRVSAWRQVQELQSIEAGKLTDVSQRMDFSRRRLELVETDEVTQQQQDKIVDMLTKLIKEEEKKECSSNCKKGGT